MFLIKSLFDFEYFQLVDYKVDDYAKNHIADKSRQEPQKYELGHAQVGHVGQGIGNERYRLMDYNKTDAVDEAFVKRDLPRLDIAVD